MGAGNSIQLNPSTANIALTLQGSEFLWTWFSLFTAAAILLITISHLRPMGNRAFHYIAVAILCISAVSLFLLASNLGWTPIAVEYVRSGSRGRDQLANGAPFPPTRSIGYARWVDYCLSVPLLLLLLVLCTGFPLSRVFITLFFGLLMTVLALIAALIRTRYKWGIVSPAPVSSVRTVPSSSPFPPCGCHLPFLSIRYATTTTYPSDLWYTLLLAGRASAFRLGDDYGRAYIRSAVFLSGVWVIYPIIWACSEGGNVITVTSECIAYGVLDLLTKLIFPFFHLYNIEGLDYERFGFNSGKYSDGAHYPWPGSSAPAPTGTGTGTTAANGTAPVPAGTSAPGTQTMQQAPTPAATSGVGGQAQAQAAQGTTVSGGGGGGVRQEFRETGAV
ncbi:hypothetical protein JCM11641_006424 [Rhodosporidiobolus odoratus]